MSDIPMMRPAFRTAYGNVKQPTPTTDVHIINIDPLIDAVALLIVNCSARRAFDVVDSARIRLGGGLKIGIESGQLMELAEFWLTTGAQPYMGWLWWFGIKWYVFCCDLSELRLKSSDSSLSSVSCTSTLLNCLYWLAASGSILWGVWMCLSQCRTFHFIVLVPLFACPFVASFWFCLVAEAQVAAFLVISTASSLPPSVHEFTIAWSYKGMVGMVRS